MKALLLSLLLSGAAAISAFGQSQAPGLPPSDSRYKADVLLVVAHPDDDVMVGGYLARLSLDEHKRIAVVYTTNGDGGGNAVGTEAGLALGQERQMEARRGLQSVGIENVWFFGGSDTPGQNPLRSLDHWNHGKMLDDIVRITRLTRPEIILTWLPASVAGENHGDHQAAGILAVEAFYAAGDPTRFPAQMAPSRDSLTEGLHLWQPKKLYFFTDAFEVLTEYWHDPNVIPKFRKSMGEGTGPSYDMKAISPSRHVSYGELTAVMQTFHATQEGYLGVDALKKHDVHDFEYPVPLIFGKSLVGGTKTGDVFEGISDTPASFASAPGYQPAHESGLSFEIGDPWHFYALWWKAYGLDELASLMPTPELAADFGEKLNIPLRACNHTSTDAQFDLSASLPAGWKGGTQYTRYPVKPGECYPISAQISAPTSGTAGWQELTWAASISGQQAGKVLVRVYVGKSDGVPQ